MHSKNILNGLLKWVSAWLVLAFLAGCAPAAAPTATPTSLPDPSTTAMAFGEISADGVPARRGAGNEYETVGTLSEGEVVVILAREGEWYRVLSPRFSQEVWLLDRFVSAPALGATNASAPADAPATGSNAQEPPATYTPLPTYTPPPTSAPTETPLPTSTPTEELTSEPMQESTQTPAPMETPHPAPTPTSPPAPTPRPQWVVPTLAEPAAGDTYANPLIFRWNGALGTGQAFQVLLHHPQSGQRIETGPLSELAWTHDLPAERVGEWRWSVRVIKDGTVLGTSEERMFWFDPWKGRNLAPSPGEPTPTPHPPNWGG